MFWLSKSKGTSYIHTYIHVDMHNTHVYTSIAGIHTYCTTMPYLFVRFYPPECFGKKLLWAVGGEELAEHCPKEHSSKPNPSQNEAHVASIFPSLHN